MSKNKTFQKLVEDWNQKYPIGTSVLLTNDDGQIEHTKTRSPAWCLYSGYPVVSVNGRAGGYLLTRIKPDLGVLA